MGCVISSIEEIDNLRFTQPRKGRVVAAKRVLFVSDTEAIIELDTGEFTVAGRRHAPNGNWAVLGYGLDKLGGAVLDGLVRFGILTKEQVAAHKSNERARSEAQERKWAKESLVKACKKLGVEPPRVAASRPASNPTPGKKE